MLKKCKCGYWYETTWQDLKKSWYVYGSNKRKETHFHNEPFFTDDGYETCTSCGGDDIECLDNCTKHKCVSCGKEHNTKTVVDSN